MLMSQINNDCKVEIIKINLPSNIIRKLDVIGLYEGSKIFIKSTESTKSVVIFEINNIKYGIRKNDAKFISVKKDNL